MVLSHNDVEKISDLIHQNSSNFVHNFKTLISLFQGQIDDAALTRFSEVFIMARKIVPDSELVDAIGPYFMKFEQPIIDLDEDYMLNYDYESLIVEDCEKSTAELIRALTTNIIGAYLRRDENLNNRIRETILKIVKNSKHHVKLCKMLK
jgi:hypothetical protein